MPTICPSSSRRVAKRAGREACTIARGYQRHCVGTGSPTIHRRLFEPTRGETKCVGVLKHALEFSGGNHVTRRVDYTSSDPHLLQRPFNPCLSSIFRSCGGIPGSTPTTTNTERLSCMAPMVLQR